MALKEEILAGSADLCRQFRIRRLGLFGSVARGEETAFSDIDLLVEFEDPSPATMPDRFLGFQNAAARRFRRDVQLLTPSMVRNPFFKRSLERDLVIVYE